MITGYRPLPLVGRVSGSTVLEHPTTVTKVNMSQHPPALWMNAGHFCHGVIPTAAAAIAIDKAISEGDSGSDDLADWEAIHPRWPVPPPFKQLVSQCCSWWCLLMDYKDRWNGSLA
jgi:glycine/D-amino acid oxidase-like deaminating enzyme